MDMETVKEFLGCINPHWVAVVAAGMYTHLREIYIIGLCFNDRSTDPSYASALFTFSVLCLLAEYKLWPRTLKEPPIQLLYIYEMLIAALTTNLAMHAIWEPFVNVIRCLTQESSVLLHKLNGELGLSQYSFLTDFAYYMEKESVVTHMSFCTSILTFVWMLDATESLDAILDIWTNERSNNFWIFNKCKRKKISFANPEVTDWFVYKFMCSKDLPNANP
ncbi:uncharacterized protein LOC128895707 isoform X2 [Hylaeus anthracinus]|uniref:uncharacterized protein LOC128895707 isoform X2 n=1 Tax=Hylaeus anthracinus TaxID=313031 RepID=UPI0023B8AF06|nr:uncharacterized protein LOC128895707 isoform X2 [Hylaeus anthracinus]